ncbi:hypothetical protein DSS3P8_092 [Roseobacter phage DSS3P8]|nr:hypothetical protein DSS3P8_092 [Roseobacter phage DSS3P8]
MGQSTDAILVYGILLEGEDSDTPEFLGDFNDFEEFVEDALAMPPYGDPDRPTYADRDAMIRAYPVTMVTHCSLDYPMYILAVPGTEITANRGHAHTFDEWPHVDGERRAAFHAWAEAHGIEGEGKWILCSMVG